ncbi:MAG TPA: hypothetical protein DEQ09_03190 [Bacteroidales bacterium]|nr:hypothetical protein [Bacteroidales bacterium]
MNFKNRISKQLVAMLLFVFIGGVVMAQTVVRGTVSSAEEGGGPIPGVAVVVQGTTVGTTTDANGQYSITVEDLNVTLIFRYIGFLEQQVAVNGRSVVDVIMQPSLEEVGEVVVTALGIRRERKALGYSVGEVDNEELANAQEANVITALSGKVAGVQISTSSSQPGGAARITIRGNSSLLYNNQPLFIVDGIPFDNSETGSQDGGPGTSTGLDLDPINIENISILKGAAASALYGSRAANGVILVTTKSGKLNTKPTIKISHRSTFDKIYETPLQETWAMGLYSAAAGGYVLYDTEEGEYTSSSWGPKISDVVSSGEATKYDRWKYFKTGYTSESSFSISGGSENISYFGAINHTDLSGVLDPTKLRRTSFTTNLTAQVTDKVKATVGLNYINTDNDRLIEGWSSLSSFMNSFLASPWTWNPEPIVDDNGRQRIYRYAGRNNYLWIQENTRNNVQRHRFKPVFTLEYQILEGLNLTGRAGVDFYSQRRYFYVNVGSIAYGSTTGSYSQANEEYFSFNSDILLNYRKEFMGGDLKTDFMIGHNIQTYQTKSEGIDGADYNIPEWYNIYNCSTQTPWSNIWQRRSYSGYGQAVISFRDFLYYTFTGRNDWSSTLPTENNSYFYSSNSLGFIFSELVEIPFLNYGKIRASYASVGNDAPAYSIFTRSNVANAYGGAGIPSLQYPYNGVGSYLEGTAAGNTDLKNEETNEWEFGLELRMFNNRIGFEGAVYNKISLNQILPANTPITTGFSSVLMNIGKISNKGVELSLNLTPVKTENLSWDVNLNWYKNKSVVEKIADGVPSIDTGGNSSIVEGEPYAVFRGSQYVRDDNGNKVVDDDPASSTYGYYLIDYGQNIIGTNEPDFAGGVRNTVTYKNLSLTAFFDFRVGNVISSGTDYYLLYYGMAKRQEDRPANGILVHEGVKGHYDASNNLILSGEVNDIESEVVKGWQWYYSYVTEESIQPGDFLKLRDVSLTYTLPRDILSKVSWIDNVSFTAQGRNLLRIYAKDFSGSDPEVNQNGIGNSQGWSTYMMPDTKSYSFGISITFK